jgi:hypothetical protein
MSPASEDNVASIALGGFGDRIMLSRLHIHGLGGLHLRSMLTGIRLHLQTINSQDENSRSTDEQIQGILVDNPRRFLAGV